MSKLGAVVTGGIVYAQFCTICLAVVSVLIAAIAAYTGLKLARQIRFAQGRKRSLWVIGGAGILGASIWAIQLTAMLAFHLLVSNNYNPLVVLVVVGIIVLINLTITLLMGGLKQHRGSPKRTVQRQSQKLKLEVEGTAQLHQALEQLRNEITERQRAEEELRFLQKITQAICEAANFDSALQMTLQSICNFTGWKFAEAWIPSLDGKTLECSPAWYSTSQELEKFRLISEKLTFEPLSGLPGRVWLLKQPEWLQDVSNQSQTTFLRQQIASEVGLRTGLGIPVIDDDQVLAVLVFFMFEALEEDKQLVEIVLMAATQLSSLIRYKQAEAALRQSEENFHLLVEGMKNSAIVRLLVEGMHNSAIFMLDLNGSVVSWNSGAERIAGYKVDEIINMHFSCFYLEEDIALGKPDHQLHLCRINGQIEDQGWRVCKDGSHIWANVAIAALRDQQGQLCGFSIVMRDITEHKHTEEELLKSEARLQAILDNSTALIYVKDLQGKYILVNAWFGILLNKDRKDIVGKTDYDIFPDEIADVLRANDQKVLEARRPLDWEEVAPQPDGLHTYLAVKFPLYNSAGVPYAVCSISTDITERKQAEEALRFSMATNRALLNAIPDLLFRINREGIFVNFKAAKDKNLLMPQGEFLGKHVYEVFPTQVAESFMNCLERALHTDEVQILECQMQVDKQVLDYEVRIAVSAENEVMAIVRDITERKRVEQDIRISLEKEKELSLLKSRFITTASHEFRTPLTTILSSAELLEHYSNKWSEEKKLTHIQRIQSSVKHMTGLLNDVLLIGKAEAGKLEFSPTLIDISQFCRELVEGMQLSAGDRSIIFRNRTTGTTSYMMDEKLLRHILNNLLSNAIKYSPEGSTINLDLVCEQGEAIFRIQDRGIGIPEADRAQLFNSFHRASNVGTISGTGLGLAIVKKSVDLHGGKITFESEVGVGTTFTITLPLHK